MGEQPVGEPIEEPLQDSGGALAGTTPGGSEASVSRSGVRNDESASLTIRGAVGKSLGLLSSHERRQYRLVVGAQMATSLLDLIGVLLIGAVGLLAATSVQGGSLPDGAMAVIDRLGLEDVSTEMLTGVLAVAAAAFLLVKSGLYGLLIHRVYRFLGLSQAEATSRLTRSLMYQPLSSLESRPSQETAYALTGGASAAFLGVLGSLSVILAELALLVVLGAALVLINPLVTIVAIGFLASVGFAVQRGLSSWSRRLGSDIGASSVDSYEAVQESIASHREMFVSDRRDLAIQRVTDLLARFSTSIADSHFASQIPKLVYESALVVGAIGLVGWQLLTTDRVTAVTTLAVFLAAGSRIVPSMLRVSVQSASIANSVGQAQSTYELAERVTAGSELGGVHNVDTAAKATQLRDSIVRGYEGFDARIVMDRVTFSYPGATAPAVRNLVPPESGARQFRGVGRQYGCGQVNRRRPHAWHLDPDQRLGVDWGSGPPRGDHGVARCHWVCPSARNA